jgi:hypothetical protein
MVADVLAGLSGLKIALDIAKGLKDITDVTTRNRAIIELQEKILAAQSAQLTLVETISDLKKRVADLEAWETEKQRYDLTEISVGVFAYVIKPAMRGAEPIHCLCSTCYQDGRKSILQKVASTYSDELMCPRCKAEVSVTEDHPGYPFMKQR